ncbi:MAG: hypothetical protein GC186_14835 [Rhodobacteraceae bacterium]|nr:hypothetical protein [Paracoccaceae bacterium]
MTPRRTRKKAVLAVAASLASGLAYAQVASVPTTTDPGTTLTFGVLSTLRSDSNLDMTPTSPGTATLFDTALNLGLHSHTRLSSFDLTLGGVLRAAHLPGGGSDTRFDGQSLRLGFSHASSAAKLTMAASYDAASLLYLDPLTATQQGSVDLAPSGGTRRLYAASIGLETGIDRPLGFLFSAQTSARRYSGASAAYYDSTNTQLSMGARIAFSDTTTGKIVLTGSDFSAKDAARTRYRARGLDFTLGHDFDARTHLDATLGTSRSQTVTTGGDASRTEPTLGLVLTRTLDNSTATFSVQRSLSPGGARTTLTGGQAIDMTTGKFSYSLGATRGDSGDVEAIATLGYMQTLPTGQITANLSRQVVSPLAFTGLDAGDELVTRVNVSYRYNVNQLSGVRFGIDYARVDPVAGNGVVPRRGSGFSAAYEHALTQDWMLTAGYRYRNRTDPVNGTASGNSVFFSIGRNFTVRP